MIAYRTNGGLFMNYREKPESTRMIKAPMYADGSKSEDCHTEVVERIQKPSSIFFLETYSFTN